MLSIFSRVIVAPIPRRVPWWARLIHSLGICAKCESGGVWIAAPSRPTHHIFPSRMRPRTIAAPVIRALPRLPAHD